MGQHQRGPIIELEGFTHLATPPLCGLNFSPYALNPTQRFDFGFPSTMGANLAVPDDPENVTLVFSPVRGRSPEGLYRHQVSYACSTTVAESWSDNGLANPEKTCWGRGPWECYLWPNVAPDSGEPRLSPLVMKARENHNLPLGGAPRPGM